MASLQGWWVRETYIRGIEILAPPALAGLAAGTVYRGITAPLARARFVYSHKVLVDMSSRIERVKYLFFNRPPLMWPKEALRARPVIGTVIPFPFVASAAFALYTGGKRMWINNDDRPGVQFGKSVTMGAAAGHITRLFFYGMPNYRMVIPAPYLATALPVFDALRPNHSLLFTSLTAALTGSIVDGIMTRTWALVHNLVQSVRDPKNAPPAPRFRSVRELVLWTVMLSTRSVPRAILLGGFDVFFTLFEPYKRHAREYLTPVPVRPRRPPPPPAAISPPPPPPPPPASDVLADAASAESPSPATPFIPLTRPPSTSTGTRSASS